MANIVDSGLSKIPVVGEDITVSYSAATQPWIVTDISYDNSPPVVEVLDQDGTTAGRVAYNTTKSQKCTLDVIVYGTSESDAGSKNSTAVSGALSIFSTLTLASAAKHSHLAGTWSVQSAKAKASNTGMQTWSVELARLT